MHASYGRLLSVLILLFGVQAVARDSTPIVSYRYGSMGTFSHMTIHGDGKAIISEKAPSMSYASQTAVQLASEQFADLKKLVEEAAKGVVKITLGHAAKETSASGYVIVRTAAGEIVAIENVLRARVMRGQANDMVHKIDGAATTQVLRIIEPMVVNKISSY